MTTTLNNDFVLFSTGQTIGASSSATMKNRIINGAMVIDQRNNGGSVTNATSAIYTVDRWASYGSVASKFSVQQNAGSVTPPTGFANYLGITSLSSYSVTSTDEFEVYQIIEGYNVADLNWGKTNAKTVTLSFWVYSSLTGTFGGALQSTGASRSYPFSYSIPVANTWTPISIIINGDTTGTWNITNGQGIVVFFGLGQGSTRSATAGAWTTGNFNNATGATSVVGTSGATFYLTGVQLEVGTVASSFDYRDIGRELIMCQRYYETGSSILPAFYTGGNFGGGVIIVKYSVTKRTAASFNPTRTGGSGSVTTLSSGNNTQESSQVWWGASSANVGDYSNFTWTAIAEL